eukprot:2865547-Pyramimonas_sp.AAC.2
MFTEHPTSNPAICPYTESLGADDPNPFSRTLFAFSHNLHTTEGRNRTGLVTHRHTVRNASKECANYPNPPRDAGCQFFFRKFKFEIGNS